MTSTFNIIRNLISLMPPNFRQYLIAAAKPLRILALDNVNYIVFSPTYLCNYQCPYCIQHKTNHAKIYPRKNEHGWREWITEFNKLPPSVFFISGGDPFSYREIIDLIKNMPSKHFIAAFNTNLSKPLGGILDISPNNIFNIIASYHPHMTERDIFTKQVLNLKDNGFNVTVTVVAHPEIMIMLDDLKLHFENEIKVKFIIESYIDPSYEYSAGERAVLKKYIKKSRKQGYDLNDRNLKQCKAGSKYFVLQPNGDVYACGSGHFCTISPIHERLGKNGEFFLGNLFTGTFSPLSGPRECSIPCSEACDISLSRVKLINKKPR